MCGSGTFLSCGGNSDPLACIAHTNCHAGNSTTAGSASANAVCANCAPGSFAAAMNSAKCTRTGCGAGEFTEVAWEGTKASSVVCKPCPQGTWSTANDTASNMQTSTCRPHKQCGPQEKQVAAGTASSNAICMPKSLGAPAGANATCKGDLPSVGFDQVLKAENTTLALAVVGLVNCRLLMDSATYLTFYTAATAGRKPGPNVTSMCNDPAGKGICCGSCAIVTDPKTTAAQKACALLTNYASSECEAQGEDAARAAATAAETGTGAVTWRTRRSRRSCATSRRTPTT